MIYYIIIHHIFTAPLCALEVPHVQSLQRSHTKLDAERHLLENIKISSSSVKHVTAPFLI